MQITRQTEYAFRTMIELAKEPYGQLMQTRTISQRQDIPEVFLKKIIQVLAKSRLISTQRGVQGGVRLAKPPEKVTLRDVFIAIEGFVAINVCLVEDNYCPNEKGCQVRRVLKRTQEAMLKELDRETLLELANKEIEVKQF